MTPTETVRAYYRALRRGDPLEPYFAEREDVVKFGVSERLAGYDAIATGLREQTRTTGEWRVDSRALRTTDRESVAWFTDEVGLSWTPTDGERLSFDTRWSGVLERTGDAERIDGAGAQRDDDWQFAQVHVSAPRDL